MENIVKIALTLKTCLKYVLYVCILLSNSFFFRDETEDGLILEEGVGLRLRTLEYWLCSETGLVYYPSESHNKERSPKSLMLVVVESLPGQSKFFRLRKLLSIYSQCYKFVLIKSQVQETIKLSLKWKSCLKELFFYFYSNSNLF